MALWDMLTGEFIDVIAWTDDTRDTIVWRFERQGHAIKYGAKLTVREGQAAVFVHEGQIADVFGPGLYMLETNNLPIMTTLQHWDHGFRSPFKSEVYFVNTTRFNDLKWGTKNPITCRDPEFGMVRLRAFGTYSIRVSDPARFLAEIVGTDGEFTTDEITFQIRNVIVQEFSRAIAASGIPVLDMAANTADLSKLIAKAIEPTISAYGISIPELYIENISLPENVEAVLDKRTSMGIIGNDLHRYTQISAAEAMTKAAGQPGGAMGAAIGAGMGMGMGGAMAGGMGPWGQAPAGYGQPQGYGQGHHGSYGQGAGQGQPPAPPIPAEKVWHVARSGVAEGPFSRASLGRQASDGSLTRDTLVWTQGQDGWVAAGEIDELARLFTVSPPPPPIPGTTPEA